MYLISCQVNYDTVVNSTANTNSNITTIPLLCIYPRDEKICSHKDLHTNVHSSIIHSSKKLEINPYAHQLING